MSKNTDIQNRFKYTQLYEILAAKITEGEWKPNDRIPTEQELCQRYNLSRITVRDALNLLTKDGYIYRKQGKGTFVAVRPIEQKLTKLYTLREEIKEKGMTPSNKILSFKKCPAEGRIKEILQLEDGEFVYELIRCLYASEIPYAVETSYIPAALCTEMTEEMIAAQGLYHTMRSFGAMPERATERLSAVAVGREDALLLNIRHSEPAIRIERTTFSKTAAIEYTATVVKNDFFSYTVELH